MSRRTSSREMKTSCADVIVFKLSCCLELFCRSLPCGGAGHSRQDKQAPRRERENDGRGVAQINGHSYVDVETLAQLTNGVVTVEPTRIVLTIPSELRRPSECRASAPAGLSKDFASAAVSALAEMREWRGAIGQMITYGLVVSGSWSPDYSRPSRSRSRAGRCCRDRRGQKCAPAASERVRQADGVGQRSAAARQALNGANTVDPNALKNDPSLAKITDCGRFLNGMVVSHSDNAGCR